MTNIIKILIFFDNTDNIALLKTNLFKDISGIMKNPTQKKSCISLYTLIDILNKNQNNLNGNQNLLKTTICNLYAIMN